MRKAVVFFARFWKRDRGQAVVELALVAPLLILLLVGMVEFGRVWNVQLTLTEAARLGVRTASVADPAVNNATYVTNLVKQVLARSGLDTTSTNPNAAQVTTELLTTPGTLDVVTVTYPYRFTFVGFMLEWTNSSVTVTGRAVMRNE